MRPNSSHVSPEKLLTVEPHTCSVLQPLQDKDGKKCLFLIKSAQKSFEISVSDKKKKQEWIQGEQELSSSSASK